MRLQTARPAFLNRGRELRVIETNDGLAVGPTDPENFSGRHLIPKIEFLVYDRHSFSVWMEDFDLSRCTLVLKVIDAFFENQRGFRKTLGELKGLIVLLKEGQPALSQVLSRNWSLLHEFDAKMVYRRSPGPSQEQRELIDLILIEMKSHILEAIGNRPHLAKPVSGSLFEHVSVGRSSTATRMLGRAKNSTRTGLD